METVKKMNICAGGATGLNGARAAPQAKGPWHGWGVAAEVAGPWAKGDNRTVPVSCLLHEIFDELLGTVNSLGVDDDGGNGSGVKIGLGLCKNF